MRLCVCPSECRLVDGALIPKLDEVEAVADELACVPGRYSRTRAFTCRRQHVSICSLHQMNVYMKLATYKCVIVSRYHYMCMRIYV